MSAHDDSDLEQLRRADPARSSGPPSDSKARVWARIQEVTMEESKYNASRRRTSWVVSAATFAALALVALAVLINANPGTPSDGAGPAVGSCVETYSRENLAKRDYAIDGTVTAIEGDNVTFAVNRVFGGDVPASVTLKAPGMTGSSVTSAGGPNLAIGGRYLVAGDGDFVWACGFTQPYDADTATEWEQALSS